MKLELLTNTTAIRFVAPHATLPEIYQSDILIVVNGDNNYNKKQESMTITNSIF